MPYGVSWGYYLKTLGSSMLAMVVGSQVVHSWYQPDLSIPDIPPQKGELHTKLYSWKKSGNKNFDSD